jgi:hypothetical protein
MHPTSQAPSSPSSSRMLAGYLTDIEQLLDEQRWDVALREASDLPRIAVALSSPDLCCSAEAVGMWCREWIRPPASAAGACSTDPDSHQEPKRVPAGALRRLQLRRHVRTPPRGFTSAEPDELPAQESRSVEAGRALVGAARRWYACSGCHDPTVQANLTRLAVLR